MLLELFRYNTTDTDTLGFLMIDGRLACYTIEDTQRAVKVDGQTRIPSGTYQILLRDEGGMTKRYRNRFGDMHRGMLHLQDVPEFSWVYLHVGNTEDDSLGCLIVGDIPPTIGTDQRVGASTSAYQRIYPLIADAVELAESVDQASVWIKIVDLG